MKTPPLLIATLTVGIPVMLRAQPPDKGYELLFEDNFDGNKVNESDWVYRLDRRGGEANFSNINGLNRKENVSVSDGLLHIRVDQEMLNGKKENTGGGLITKRRFGYGYYESRYRPFMRGNGGVHTAFWQRGPALNVLAGQALDPTTPKENVLFEIDSSEIDNPKWISTNNLYDVIATRDMSDGYPWPARFHIPVKPLDGGWFIDSYEYTPTSVIFYDNKVEVARIDYDRIRGQQNVWLTALNGFGKNIDATVFPGESSFDYFRFYAKDYPGANLLGNDSFEYNLDRIDVQDPVTWFESGDVEASYVATGEAASGNARLRHASDKTYKVTTRQTLQYIPNGTYTASAMVRSSGGQRVAKMRVFDNGAAEQAVDIPAVKDWTRVKIDKVEVKGHAATIGFTADADAGQWLEVDDVEFMKPALPGQTVVKAKPFEAVRDPIWQILPVKPMTFGDGRFVFFGREVGGGDAFTVAFKMKPATQTNQVVIERMPRKGSEGGWCVRLTQQGDVAFRIGSAGSFSEVVVPNAYAAGKQTDIACVFDHGTATVYVDGKVGATLASIKHNTLDKTAAGSIGIHRTSTKEPYVGDIQNARIYNRAVGAGELFK